MFSKKPQNHKKSEMRKKYMADISATYTSVASNKYITSQAGSRQGLHNPNYAPTPQESQFLNNNNEITFGERYDSFGKNMKQQR